MMLHIILKYIVSQSNSLIKSTIADHSDNQKKPANLTICRLLHLKLPRTRITSRPVAE